MSFSVEEGCSVACNEKSYRNMKQCFGVCKVNPETVGKIDNNPDVHKACMKHFHFDNNYHSSGLKKSSLYPYHQLFQKKAYFVQKYIKYFLEVKYVNHFRQVLGKNIVTSCISQFTCSSYC